MPCHRNTRSISRRWIACDEILELAIVVGEHDHRNVESGLLDLAGQTGRVHIANFEIRDDQVEAGTGARDGQGFHAGRYLRDPRDLLKVEFERFTDQKFVQSAVLAQNERVVEAGDEQDVAHPEGHQVLEAFEEPLRVHGYVGDVFQGHGRIQRTVVTI